MDQSSRFLLKTFRKYYKSYTPWMPERHTKREFGFMFFDRDIMQRHLGFANPDELKAFMVSKVPMHSYYSTAYYRRPAAPTMEEKDWMGAELIFDLDADHLKDADKMTYDEMLLRIREEMVNLVDSFLMGDLGFSEDQIQLTFSGGRGYHAHIMSPDVLILGAHERRELVDYITYNGIDIDWVFPVEREAMSSAVVHGQTRVNVSERRAIPDAEEGGWKRRMRHGLEEVVEDICTMDLKSLKKTYPSMKNMSQQTFTNVQTRVKGSRNAMFERNNMGMLPKTTQDTLIRIMQEDKAPSMSGEVDKPVTPDIKRLIRLPGSVHGKTGLRVSPLTRQELGGYSPLEHAVPDVYSDEPVKITLRRPYELAMRGERFSLKAGETEVPEFAAVFLIGRREAKWGFDSERKDSFL